MIPESGIMERWHQRHVSRLHCSSLPNLGSLWSPIFSLFDSTFCLFPLCGAWSQASYQVVSSMPVTSDLQLGLYKDLGLELGPHSWVTTHSLLPSFVYHCAACWWLLAPYLWCCRRNTEGAFSMIAPQDINCLHCYFAFLAGVGSHSHIIEGIPANMLPACPGGSLKNSNHCNKWLSVRKQNFHPDK